MNITLSRSSGAERREQGLFICFQPAAIEKFHSNIPPLNSSELPNDSPWGVAGS